MKERFKEGSDSFPETGFAGLVERFDLTKPIVAFVNGDAIGGGLKIVLSCDLAIAVDHAKFGLPEPKLVLAAKGGLHRFPRQIPLKHVMQIVLTGKLFDAQTALKYGLINQIVEKKNFAKEAQNILDDLIECAPLSLRASKQMIMQGIDALTLKDAYQRNFSEHDIMLSSDDVHEGNRAFP